MGILSCQNCCHLDIGIILGWEREDEEIRGRDLKLAVVGEKAIKENES
jgi:hypothetical protein